MDINPDNVVKNPSKIETKSYFKNIILIIVGILLLIIGIVLGYILASKNVDLKLNNKKTSQNLVKPSPTSLSQYNLSHTFEAVTLDNANIIRVYYPTAWQAEAQNSNGVINGVNLSGPEGNIEIIWDIQGGGFGGGCSPHINVNFAGETVSPCLENNPDGSQSMVQLYTTIKNIHFAANVKINKFITPGKYTQSDYERFLKNNKNTILAILGSIKIIPSGTWLGFNSYINSKAKFDFLYPATWYINTYPNSNDDGPYELSDFKNSSNMIEGESLDHTRIDITYYPHDTMPTTFPFTNGSNVNNTIEPYLINSYSGISGQEANEAGLTTIIYLKNPKGGYISFILIPAISKAEESTKIFNQLLASFKFH